MGSPSRTTPNSDTTFLCLNCAMIPASARNSRFSDMLAFGRSVLHAQSVCTESTITIVNNSEEKNGRVHKHVMGKKRQDQRGRHAPIHR